MSEELVWQPFHRPDERPIWLLITRAEQVEYKSATSYDCEHPRRELRDRTVRGGSIQRTEQCLICGLAAGGAVRQEAGVSVPLWDEQLAERVHRDHLATRDRVFDAGLNRTANLETEGYADYQDYLRTDAWIKKRRIVLERDSSVCQSCLEAKAIEVHHLTYDRIFEEPLFDLVAVCGPCHVRLHRKKIAALAAGKARRDDIPDAPWSDNAK